jgi:hypothetical protein
VKPAVLVTTILLFSSLAEAQTRISVGCSQTDVDRTAAQVASVRKRMLNLPIGDDLQTNISPLAQHTIALMKAALSDFIKAYLRCASLQSDPEKINSGLSALGQAFEMPNGFISNKNIPPDFGKFGFELSFQTRLFQNPRLLGVTANFSIKCGDDTVLLIFSPSGGSWNEVLHWQKKTYTTIAGGTLAFDYGISPPDGLGKWFLVTKELAPSCISTWSDIRYAVLRRTSNPDRSETLFSGSDPIWWGSEDFGTLTVRKRAFDLRFHSTSIDPGAVSQVRIRRYSVVGDAVRGIQP